MSATRIRSFSAAMPPQDAISHVRNSSKNSMPPPPLPASLDISSRGRAAMPPFQSSFANAKHNPPRHLTRKSIDLDDDDYSSDMSPSTPARQAAAGTKLPVSAGARDLMDFLAKGPPEDFRPPPSPFLETPKKSGRLQRMISKLTLKEKDKDSDSKGARHNNGSADSISKSSRSAPSVPTSPLYTKPIPPRIAPAPISPPSSSASSIAEQDPTPAPIPSRARKSSSVRKAVPALSMPELPVPAGTTAPETSSAPASRPVSRPVSKPSTPVRNSHIAQAPITHETSVPGGQERPVVPAIVAPVSPPARNSSKNATIDITKTPETTSSQDIAGHARDMHRTMVHATNADECRLLLDMFLIRSGLHLDISNPQQEYPSPPSDMHQPLPFAVQSELENSLVELFLGSLVEDEESEESLASESSVTSDSKAVTFPVSPPDTPLVAQSSESSVSDTPAPTPAPI